MRWWPRRRRAPASEPVTLPPGTLGIIGEQLVRAYKDGHAHGKAAARTFPQTEIYLYLCPWCKGGEDPDDSPVGCRHCGGRNLTNDVAGWEPHELTRAPLPPALMPAACGSCAFRRGSPEEQSADFGSIKLPGFDQAFFCHRGMIGDNDRGYSSVAWVGELPLGAYLCRGWWDQAIEGNDAPELPYRDTKARV